MKLFAKWRKQVTKQVSKPEETIFATHESPKADVNIGQGRKILVVDDNMIVLKAFEIKLKACGFETFLATEGAAAVSAARANRPDLIVLDINFPPDVGSSGMQWDGFNIMQWLRRFQEAANIPVIIMTSGDPAVFQHKAMNHGAVAFFQKPINYDDFLLAVHRAITNCPNGDAATHARPAVQPA
jgi:twitching motility two-component system response regulator PilH